MSSQCRECCVARDADLQHCHGTVIHHSRYRSECTENGCDTPEVVHAFAVDCEAIGCRCGEQITSVAAATSSHRVGRVQRLG